MGSKCVKHSWLSDLANEFGMNTTKFAESIGYTRQTLYNASNGVCRLSKHHVELACLKLITLSESIMDGEVQLAKKRHENRLYRVKDFRERFCGGVEDGK